MRRRIRIEIPAIGTRYVAAVGEPAHLTQHPEKARRHQDELTADIAVRQWESTLTLLGFASFDIWHEDATA